MNLLKQMKVAKGNHLVLIIGVINQGRLFVPALYAINQVDYFFDSSDSQGQKAQEKGH